MSDPTPEQSTPPSPGEAEVVTEQEVSQGQRRTGLSRVLVVSLVLVVIVLFGLYAMNASRLSTNNGAGGQSGVISHREANAFNAPEPAPKPAPANGTAASSNQPTPSATN